MALTTNKKSQKIIYREKAIPTLLELLKTHESLAVKVSIHKNKNEIKTRNYLILFWNHIRCKWLRLSPACCWGTKNSRGNSGNKSTSLMISFWSSWGLTTKYFKCYTTLILVWHFTVLIWCSWYPECVCLNALLSKSSLSERLSRCGTCIVPVCLQQQSPTEGNSTNRKNSNEHIRDIFEFWQWDRKSKRCISGSQKIQNIYIGVQKSKTAIEN